MILADTLAELFRTSEKVTDTAKSLRVMLDGAAKFVFEPDTARLAAEAITRPAEVAKQIPLPDELTWLEFHLEGRKLGFFFYATDSETLRDGRCLIVELKAGAEDLTITTELMDMDAGGLVAQANYNPLLMGALALLGTPDLVERREISQAKLNKARTKRGKPHLYAHTDLRLIDLDLARPSRPWTEAPEPGGPGRRHKREHFCRAHLRFRLGRMELVRPHWRGDASLGRVNPAYRVRAGAMP